MKQDLPTCRSLPALAIYSGKVMHARLKPRHHRFSYRVFSILVDLDRLEEASKQARLFSVNRPNLLSFHESDHGPRDGSSLRSYIDRILAKGGIERPAQVFLWCNPRVFGYTFNPLSVYYCIDTTGQITTLVYQVHNTFGEDHTYVARVSSPDTNSGSIRQTALKHFYVSPFLEMGLRYHFRINPPDEQLKIRILETDDEGPVLSASFSGRSMTVNSWNFAKELAKTLGLTWKIMAGIHFEAFFLWLKGARLHKRPEAPEKTSYPPQEEFVAGK
ncbi:MAG: DUF1365 domain-containing protein [Rhizobiaceae bacterium]|nr:DUF1365 domain-containing protein [Rhizobiaceae bacterium]